MRYYVKDKFSSFYRVVEAADFEDAVDQVYKEIDLWDLGIPKANLVQGAGDEHMGEWVYCSQHLNVHASGWCTVEPRDKLGLHVETEEEGIEKCKEIGLKLYTSPIGPLKP